MAYQGNKDDRLARCQLKIAKLSYYLVKTRSVQSGRFIGVRMNVPDVKLHIGSCKFYDCPEVN